MVGSGGNTVTLSLSNPGANGNNVTLQFISGATVPDAQAVNGAGTNAITINIQATRSRTQRTLAESRNLVSAGIPTLDGGYITVKSVSPAQYSALR